MSRNKYNQNNNLAKEKLFKDIVPRSRVQLDNVKRIRAVIEKMPAQLPEKIILYQDVIRENGEYYLLYKGSDNLKPFAEYLAKNTFKSKKLLQEFKEILELIENTELLNDLFPDGINAAHFWIDEKEKVYLIPEEFLRAKRNYSEHDFEIPSKEYFMPPEVIEGEEWGEKSYIFNTASVFYYFLSGQTIFSDQDNARVLNKIQNENILEIKALLPKITDELNQVIMMMLARDKGKRPERGYCLEKLKSMLSNQQNKFKLFPFLERENVIDKKIIKKKRRNENIKLFFRHSWKVILFFAVVGGGFLWGLTSGPPPTITAENSPAEVVNYFYEGIATKNINLANEAVTLDLGEMQRMISETHVIEKMQQAYGGNSENNGEVDAIYSVEKLEIKEISASEAQYRFRASYEFNFRDRDGRYSESIEDQLIVEKIDGIFRITAIEGDMKEMIAGDYPWREE